MKHDTPDLLSLNKCGRKNVYCSFDQPRMSSEGGMMAVRELLTGSSLIRDLAEAIDDKRHQSYVDHSYFELLLQRIGQILCGYADANDSNELRKDPILKMFVGRDPSDEADLGSQPTMNRFENAVSRKDLYRMGEAILQYTLKSYTVAPKSIVIDMDPTAHRGYGAQQLLLFNTHVGGYCHMPFHVYEGATGKLLAAIMRPGKTPDAREIITILKRLVKQIRKAYPKVTIIFRADSHHAKPEVLDWLEDHRVDYIIGLAQNAVLNRMFESTQARAERQYKGTWKDAVSEVRQYDSGYYAAGTWRRQRRVICRALSSVNGNDRRYIVTSFKVAMPKYLYDTVYCGRGNAELFIKDHKLGTGSDRSSCISAEANQFRLFLHSAAYIILHELREKVLKNTKLEKASFTKIILQLVKTAAVVEVKKTKIHIHFPKEYAHKDIFAKAVAINDGFQAGHKLPD